MDRFEKIETALNVIGNGDAIKFLRPMILDCFDELKAEKARKAPERISFLEAALELAKADVRKHKEQVTDLEHKVAAKKQRVASDRLKLEMAVNCATGMFTTLDNFGKELNDDEMQCFCLSVMAKVYFCCDGNLNLIARTVSTFADVCVHPSLGMIHYRFIAVVESLGEAGLHELMEHLKVAWKPLA